MNRTVSSLFLIALLLSGCQSGMSALDEAATMVAQTVAAASPTYTPSPTSTLLPTNTATPRLTPTPNTALTATVEAYKVLSDLDVWVGSNSGVPYREGYLAWQQSERVVIDMTGPQKDLGILQAIGENISGANFIFKSDVTWFASGILICGLAFRAEQDLDRGKQYQFYFYRLSGLPAYKIDIYDFGRFKNTISDVQFSDGIDSSNGATNEFILLAQNNQFVIYINGKRQSQFYDAGKQLSEGLLAFLAWQDSGDGLCKFENSWLWILP